MKKKMLMIGFLLVIVMLGGWSPLPHGTDLMSANAASDPTLSINNLTGAAFYLTATGPQTYSFHVLAGKNNFVVLKGEYSLSYYACGAQQTKEVNVKKNGGSIKLVCDAPSKSNSSSPQLTVNNKTGASFYLTLTGPKTYTFNIPNGKSNYSVDQGLYDVSYFACGGQQTTTVNVKKKGATLTLTCTAKKTGKEIAITINNKMGGNLILTLTGPTNYQFTLPPGKTKIFVAKGTYSYTGWGPCGSTSGTIDITYKATWTWWCY